MRGAYAAPPALRTGGDRAARGPSVCGKSPAEEEEQVDTLPVEGSSAAGSGSDTLLYTCNHFCELQGSPERKSDREH